MPRDGERVRRLLQQSALDLYREHGYDATTTADIAARAGVTERTFFRHFPDKREVLFDGEVTLKRLLVEGAHAAPAEVTPMAALRLAFEGAIPTLLANRPFSEPRAAVIETHPLLRERARAKGANLVSALTDALRERGVPERSAALASEVGMAAFTHATEEWLADPSIDLPERLELTFSEVRALTSG